MYEILETVRCPALTTGAPGRGCSQIPLCGQEHGDVRSGGSSHALEPIEYGFQLQICRIRGSSSSQLLRFEPDLIEFFAKRRTMLTYKGRAQALCSTFAYLSS